MQLQQLNEALQHRISGGGEYLWTCYPNSHMLDYESSFGYVTAIFDRLTQLVYEVTVDSKNYGRPYRWVNPQFKQAMLDEATSRGVDSAEAYDDINWVDLEVVSDLLEKATGVFNNTEFDTRVCTPIDLSDAEFNRLAKMAHERDITFNALINEILCAVIESDEIRGECSLR